MCILAFGTVSAQRIYNNSFFLQNPFTYNPGYVGVNDGLQGVVQAGTFMQGSSDAPRSGLIGLNAALKNNIGMGGFVVSEQVGAFEHFAMNVSGAYKAYFQDHHFISFGIATSINRNTLNSAKLNLNRFVDMDDNTLRTDFFDETTLKFEAGVWYRNGNFEAGVSFPYLYESGGNLQRADFISVVSYRFIIEGSKFNLQPAVLVQSIPLRGMRTDGSLIGEWDRKIWAQVGYRSSGSFLAGAGFRFEDLSVGYNFGVPTAQMVNVYNNSHEVLLMLNINKKAAGILE